MIEAEPGPDSNPPLSGPGARLYEARIAQGLDVGDIAARTRIPQRHLESIEAGTYADLPSRTYAVGFARAYARAVGLDEVAIAAEVRAEIGQAPDRPQRTIPAYVVENPSRNPSRGLVVGGVVVALLVLIGVALFYGTSLFRGGSTPAATDQGEAVPIPDTVAAPAARAPGAGQVSITATDEVWVHISAANGQTLLMKTMAPGERFDLPADAQDPRIEAGRPDKLAVTVNGAAVAPLGDGRLAIKNVPLTAAALLARGGTGPVPAATPSATPTPRPSATPSPRATATPRPTPTSTRTPAAAATAVPRAFEPAFGNSTAPR